MVNNESCHCSRWWGAVDDGGDVRTAPAPLAPGEAMPVGEAAAIVEDDDGGQVFVHGNLVYAWDVGDTAGAVLRRYR